MRRRAGGRMKRGRIAGEGVKEGLYSEFIFISNDEEEIRRDIIIVFKI